MSSFAARQLAVLEGRLSAYAEGGMSLNALITDIEGLAGIVENMIVMLNINTNYSKAVQGVIIVLAVAFNVYNNRKSAGLIAPRRKRAEAAPKKEA